MPANIRTLPIYQLGCRRRDRRRLALSPVSLAPPAQADHPQDRSRCLEGAGTPSRASLRIWRGLV
jgi:hypothetical protein